MISWKHSFNRLNEEYDIAKKKRQALDNLFEKGRISQSTRDSFNNEIAGAIAEIEHQQQDLLQKMQMKTGELENQIKTLEMLLANYEIQHVTGEIDENTYELELNLLSNGLETARTELGNIQEATSKLCTPITQEPAAEPVALAAVEVAPAIAAENVEVEIAPTEVAEMPVAPEPCIEEPVSMPEIVAAPEIEAAPVMEETPIAEEMPVMEQPAAEPVAENVEAAIPEEIPQETAVIIEEAIVEQADVETVEVEVAAEPIIEEQEAVAEELIVEQPAVENTDVVELEDAQVEMSSIVEEIVPENPCQAPEAAPAESIEAAITEVCEETPQLSIPSAKETLHLVETSDSDESKEE